MNGFRGNTVAMTSDRFHGTVLGLALGDALGAPHEGGPIERLLWRLIGTTGDGRMRWSDDTQMSLDLAESLLARDGLDEDDLARRFAESYRWRRGYGPGAAKLLKRIRRGEDWRQANRSVYPAGSYGNGGAMRAPVLALFFAGDDHGLVDAARRSATITHAHALGIEGAVMLAVATAEALASADAGRILERVARACTQAEFTSRLAHARRWLDTAATPAPHEVREQLGNGVAAIHSCVTAVYLAASFLKAPFADLMAFTIALGGDVDTIAAMAAAMWGAARGATSLPAADLARLEQRERLQAVAGALFERHRQRS